MTEKSSTRTITQLARNPYSLGIAARYFSEVELFRHFEFGPTVSSLLHQINDGTHLIVEREDRMCGYLGWIRTSQERAEAWMSGNGQLGRIEGGSAIAVTMFHVQQESDILALIKAAKKLEPGLSVYWKRFYENGREPSLRAVKVKNSDPHSSVQSPG